MTNLHSFSLRAGLKTVFLDRDGVLNEKAPEGSYIASWANFCVLPGVAEALKRLNAAGLRAVVVSNQRGVALGRYTSADVEALHAAFQEVLKSNNAHVDGFYFCPHDKCECTCRKPLPGMFEQAAADFPEIDAGSSVMIGDSPSDIEFGQRLGMMTIFIEGDPAHQKPGAAAARTAADLVCQSLPEAVDLLLKEAADPTALIPSDPPAPKAALNLQCGEE